LGTRDTTNAILSIEEVKKLLAEKFTKELEIDYKSPDRIIKANQNRE